MDADTKRGTRAGWRAGADRRTQTRRLKAAAELAALAAATGTIADVYQHAADRAATLLAADLTVVRIYERTTRSLALVASAGASRDAVPAALGLGAALSGEAFRSGKPVIVERLATLVAADPGLQAFADRSAVAVPLRVGRRSAGTIAAIGRAGVIYGSDEGAVLDLFGRVIGTALERVAALAKAERRAQRLQTLHEVALTLAETADASAVLKLIVARARQLLDAERAAVRLWDRQRGALVIAAVDGDIGVPPMDAIRPGEGAAGRAFATRRPVIVADYDAWPHRIEAHILGAPRSVMAVPLLHGRQRLGSLTVTLRGRRAYRSEDAQLLALFAQQATAAFLHAHSVAEERTRAEQARRLAMLHQFAVEVMQQPDEHQVLARTAASAARLLHTEAARLWLLEAGAAELVLGAAYGRLAPGALARLPLATRSLLARVVETRAAVAASDYPAFPQAAQELLAGGVRSVIAAPLLGEDGVCGVLSVLSFEQREWTAEDQDLLALLAQHAGQALLNARRLAAMRRAAQLDAAVRFAHRASHHINNPLTVAMGWLDVLLRVASLRPGEREMAERAFAGLKRAAEAVREFQELARQLEHPGPSALGERAEPAG
jgi:GAF domain-containing protein